MHMLPIAAGVVAAAAVADLGVAGYLFRRTLMRGKAKTERTIKMAGTNWETYIPHIKQCRERLEARPHEDIFITARDGLKLHGTYFPVEGADKLVLCFHGYTSSGVPDYTGLSEFYIPHGYSMLMVDARAHGQSEGVYIGFGCLDRWDGLAWLHYLKDRFGPGLEILLHGTSMGGATVLMMSGLDLPENVKGIVSDCAFTSAWDVFDSVLRTQYHMLSSAPVLYVADAMCRQRAGYGLRECNAAEEVRRAKTPILFIHGSADTFVPCRMCDEIYAACATPKDRLIVEGAGHAEAYYKDTAAYQQKLKGFLHIEEGVSNS